MAKEFGKNRKEKRIKLPAEYREGSLHFKTGAGWKACYDRERELYTSETFQAGYYDLYEISEEIFSRLKTKGMGKRTAHALISTGRHLYKSVSDRNASYDIALDEAYASLCPWAEVQKTGELWSPELTDLAVTVFEAEHQNRDQRQEKRKKKEDTDPCV